MLTIRKILIMVVLQKIKIFKLSSVWKETSNLYRIIEYVFIELNSLYYHLLEQIHITGTQAMGRDSEYQIETVWITFLCLSSICFLNMVSETNLFPQILHACGMSSTIPWALALCSRTRWFCKWKSKQVQTELLMNCSWRSSSFKAPTKNLQWDRVS